MDIINLKIFFKTKFKLESKAIFQNRFKNKHLNQIKVKNRKMFFRTKNIYFTANLSNYTQSFGK